jgi:hypothetical protein
MQTEHGSQRQIPHHPQVPFRTRQAVIEERLSSELGELKRVGEDANKLQAISEEHRAQLVNLLGCENYQKLRSYTNEQKRLKAKLFLRPRGPQMSKGEVEIFRRERKDEAAAWSGEMGFDINRIGELNQRAAARVKELAPAHLYRNDKRRVAPHPPEFHRIFARTSRARGPSCGLYLVGHGGTTAGMPDSTSSRHCTWTPRSALSATSITSRTRMRATTTSAI